MGLPAFRMKTRIIPIEPSAAAPGLIRELASGLLRGAVMAYPTETFYGLGAAGFSKRAVGKVFRIKGREASKTLSVLASDLDMVKALSAELPPAFWVLAGEFWPGPLTLVVKAAPWLPAHIVGPDRSIALRIPPVPWLRDLVGELSQPLTATSANLAGGQALPDPKDVVALFSGKVDIILDGGRTPGGAPSTIVDLTSQEMRILREGAVPAGRVLSALGA